MKESRDEPVDHFSFLTDGDEQSHSSSKGMGVGNAYLMSEADQKERIAVKKNKGVLHGFRSSVFYQKINTAASSHSLSRKSLHPWIDTSGGGSDSDIDCYYNAAESCITPLLVRAGFEEIDGIVECGPLAGILLFLFVYLT